MNSSGEFHDIGSNKSGRLSHVSSQLVMIPSCRALLSRDKRLPLDTWNQSRVQENVLGNQFSTFDSPLRFSSYFIWRRARKSSSSPWRSDSKKNKSDKWRRTKLWRNSNADVCVKTVDYEFSTSGWYCAELRGRTAKTASIGTRIRQILIILVVEDSIQNTDLKWFWWLILWMS